jgi:hypothetical protein
MTADLEYKEVFCIAFQINGFVQFSNVIVLRNTNYINVINILVLVSFKM